MRWKGAAVSRPELPRILDACDAVGTESALYRTTGTVFPFCRVYYCEEPIMHASTAHIFHLTWSCTNFICMPSCDTLRYTFRVSRVYSSSQLCHDLNFPGSSMRAMLWGL